jgi:ribulose-phosphate 3-epimerase
MEALMIKQPLCKKAGADIFVSGSYIFGGNIEERIHKIMDAGEEM